ncbi:helix-turn-helix domain-containing protein [Clostridium oryzae]|uniref:Bifunctional transcriptional activator/DNA repair enzyme AdaA n=1 Tax=Clostridium oryzae TaxID=1450648 RepID=A0A1V4IZT0_9CLOT|nr:helix-turn-helix domain-containing protein [Clostridium oryzae]OPJ65274.1 bifunctional transcriptional activator/DNA repair enzyme AdaA [Clostridium oryzae]
MNYPEQKREIINGITYNYLCHIENVVKEGNVFPAHYHNYIEILYGISGTYEVILNGKCYKFTDGDLVLINSKEVHQINSCCQKGGQYIVLRFEPEVIYNSMFYNHLQLKYVFPFILENSEHQKVIKKATIESTFIPNLLYEILKEFQMEAYGYELAIQNHIGRIFLWILRYFHQANVDFMHSLLTNMSSFKCLQPSFDYVLEHFNEDLKATDMAALCNMSSSYFSRTFNEQMHMNFNEYVNYIRITEAEKLLISTTMNITEIANAVGFNTTSYFIKLFKSYKNISPKQFRKEFIITFDK